MWKWSWVKAGESKGEYMEQRRGSEARVNVRLRLRLKAKVKMKVIVKWARHAHKCRSRGGCTQCCEVCL